MAYSAVTDFLALWRLAAGQVSKVEMPGLDFVVAALARAGLITLSVSATPPVVSQSTTAWLQTAVPSNSAEGTMFLWNPVTAAYVAATPALLLKMLQAAANQNGVSWWTAAGGPPLNTVGNDGDFSIRTDTPYGIYGPKALGAWPASAIPGTTDTITSATLDNTFGNTPGEMLYRSGAVWSALAIGAANTLMTSTGAAPSWATLSALMDVVFGAAQGSLLYRAGASWAELAPGAVGLILSTNGPGADPSWVARTAEFPSGTAIVFYQAAAPPLWTKQLTANDYGLRVVSGTGGVANGGSAFSTVFAQTAVGNHTISVGEVPSHSHSDTIPNGPQGIQAGGSFTGFVGPGGASTTGLTGGGGSHNHTVNLTLAYVDVIIAVKN